MRADVTDLNIIIVNVRTHSREAGTHTVQLIPKKLVIIGDCLTHTKGDWHNHERNYHITTQQVNLQLYIQAGAVGSHVSDLNPSTGRPHLSNRCSFHTTPSLTPFICACKTPVPIWHECTGTRWDESELVFPYEQQLLWLVTPVHSPFDLPTPPSPSSSVPTVNMEDDINRVYPC